MFKVRDHIKKFLMLAVLLLFSTGVFALDLSASDYPTGFTAIYSLDLADCDLLDTSQMGGIPESWRIGSSEYLSVKPITWIKPLRSQRVSYASNRHWRPPGS